MVGLDVLTHASGSLRELVAWQAGRQHTMPRRPGRAHQAVHQAVALAQQGAAGYRKIAVEPGVPQAATVRLHVQHAEAALGALGHRLQLQAGAAPRRAALRWLLGTLALSPSAWLCTIAVM